MLDEGSDVLINGESATTIPLNDRALAYGDGLFETIRYCNGRLLFEDLHLQRLVKGCTRLQLQLDTSALERDIERALQMSAQPDGILKIIVSRGSGGRGYRPPRQDSTRMLTLHPLPEHAVPPEQGISAYLCRQRLAVGEALAGIKHLNRLEQVLGAAEWPEGDVTEGLMLDVDGYVIEGTRSNLFFVRNGRLHTPDLSRCGIDGIMRQVLLQRYGADAETGFYTLADLHMADEVFVSNSVIGVWPLLSLQSGSERVEWQLGPIARDCVHYFNAVLGA
ncbi:MAG: aminodeoxychorismate lyase [Gammaproteobacteria bacterium]